MTLLHLLVSLFAGSPQTAALAEKWWVLGWACQVNYWRWTCEAKKTQIYFDFWETPIWYDIWHFWLRFTSNDINDGSNRWFSTTSTGLKESRLDRKVATEKSSQRYLWVVFWGHEKVSDFKLFLFGQSCCLCSHVVGLGDVTGCFATKREWIMDRNGDFLW